MNENLRQIYHNSSRCVQEKADLVGELITFDKDGNRLAWLRAYYGDASLDGVHSLAPRGLKVNWVIGKYAGQEIFFTLKPDSFRSFLEGMRSDPKWEELFSKAFKITATGVFSKN